MFQRIGSTRFFSWILLIFLAFMGSGHGGFQRTLDTPDIKRLRYWNFLDFSGRTGYIISTSSWRQCNQIVHLNLDITSPPFTASAEGPASLTILPAIAKEMVRWMGKGHGNDDWTIIDRQRIRLLLPRTQSLRRRGGSCNE